jgi:hypothetical protein
MILAVTGSKENESGAETVTTDPHAKFCCDRNRIPDRLTSSSQIT